MPRKYRKKLRERVGKLASSMTKLSSSTPKPTKFTPSKKVFTEFPLSDTEKLSFAYQVDEKYNILEVVNVSLESLIDGYWVTIRRFDSSHGELHLHTQLTIADKNGITTTIGVKKKGGPKKWLTWAINDIKLHWENYKHEFIKQNKLTN